MKSQPTPISELSEVAPFDQIPQRALRRLAPHVDHLQVRPGAVLAREGEQAREFIVVLDGDVSVFRAGGHVYRQGAGSLIGGDAVVGRQRHDSTWLAESALDVLVINGPAYRWAAHQLLGETAA